RRIGDEVPQRCASSCGCLSRRLPTVGFLVYEECPYPLQDCASRLPTRIRVSVLIVAGWWQLRVELGQAAGRDVVLIQQAGGFAEHFERLVQRLALAHEAAQAVRDDRREASPVEQGLQRLLAGLLGLETRPLVGASRRAQPGRPQVGFRLLEPSPR